MLVQDNACYMKNDEVMIWLRKTFALSGPLPAYMGGDPHLGGQRKTREEIRQELFLRKRSRKNNRKSSTLVLKHREVYIGSNFMVRTVHAKDNMVTVSNRSTYFHRIYFQKFLLLN